MIDDDHPEFIKFLQRIDLAEAARKVAFPKGLPIAYSKDGWLVEEWPDGTIKPIKKIRSRWIKMKKRKFKLALD